MADRLKELRRIEAVQKQMVRLAEVRLVAAERTIRGLVEDKARLESYVADEGALGVPLAKAALGSLQGVERRRLLAERTKETSESTLRLAKQREKAVGSLCETASRAARRAEEDKALADVVEVWLSTHRASLR